MTTPAKIRFCTLVAVLLFFGVFAAPPARANSEVRDWKLTSGETFRGQIEEVDEEAGTVRLREDGAGKTLTVSLDGLSAIDRAWILEWIELAEELEELVKKLGGKIEHYDGKGPTLNTGFHVYYPSGEPTAGTKRPIMVLFDPSGKPIRYLLRHAEAAETTKMIIVTCDVFRNGMLHLDARKRFGEVFPIIAATVPHDPARVFMGGTSGGALRAFDLTAEFPQNGWKGVYSNGGWLGGINTWNRPYPAMRVATVNGDRDNAANQWAESETEVLQQRGCTVAVMAFEGGHQIPPPSVQVKAFKWLLGEIE